MPLNQVFRDIERENSPVLCVFDLDSTLFDISPRTQHILRLFAKSEPFVSQFPQQCKALREIQVMPVDWGIRQALIRHKIEAPLPFFETLRDFWKLHFFSSDFLHLDAPYAGAVEYVNELHNVGGKVIYLSGRDEPRMGLGTRASLNQHKFPLDADHMLRLKPGTHIGDAQFKANVFAELVKTHSVIWFFENEPVNINLIQSQFPQVNVVYMDSTHSGQAVVKANTPSIKRQFIFNKG